MPERNHDVAQVIETFSHRMTVRTHDGEHLPARIRGKKLRPVCGDFVTIENIENEPEWLITGIDARRNELTRPDSRGKVEILAANLSCVVAVAAPSPSPDWFVIDRYLAAAAVMNAVGIVVFNKSDLDATPESTEQHLAEYVSAGHLAFECSATTGYNLDKLHAALDNHVAIIVGQSGVGKSSIINKLLDASLRTADISASTGEGRHTTVNSVMLDIPGGGRVIDSPGVRDYAPAIDNPRDVIKGFGEIHTIGAECRFADCRHLREPDCAVKSAVEDGRMSPRRYESFRRLMALANTLADKYR